MAPRSDIRKDPKRIVTTDDGDSRTSTIDDANADQILSTDSDDDSDASMADDVVTKAEEVKTDSDDDSEASTDDEDETSLDRVKKILKNNSFIFFCV